ncbi:MAG: 3-keto-disaccharide hydrolase [Cyclobacteriaceae bacterium]
MKYKFLIVILSIAVITCKQKDELQWTHLWNGENLNNWNMHLGTPLTGYDSLANTLTTDDVFQVQVVEGDTLLYISGAINASLASKEHYQNYHLRMEFRWGDTMYTAYNSGLLYHSYGDFGPGLGTWMNAHEFQLMTGNMGDSYRMGETYCEIPVVEMGDGKNYQYSADGEMMNFGEEGVSKIARKRDDFEKPIGEWNVLDLYCFDGQSVFLVNGKTVMVNYNSGRYVNGEIEPLTSGNIQIQSEGGEMYIRELKLRDISGIPAEVMPQES